MKINGTNMKRTMAEMVLCFCGGILVAEYRLFFSAAVVAVGLLFFGQQRERDGQRWLGCGVAFAVGMLLLWWTGLPQQELQPYLEQQASITGTISQRQQGKEQCLLQIEQINGQSLKRQSTIVLYLPEKDEAAYERGQRIRVVGSMWTPNEASNPGGFDARQYWRSQGIFALVNRVQQIEVLEQPQGLQRLAGQVQQRIEVLLHAYLPEEKVFLLWAMLFGEKANLEEEFYADAQKLGIAHIFAVSGLHVGFLLTFLLGGLRLLHSQDNPLALLLVAMLLVFYCFLVGLTPSALRATAMGLLTLLAQYYLRFRDSYTVLAIAALLVLLLQPYALWSIGFQLSFGVTFAILYCYPLTKSWCSFIPWLWLRNTCAVALAAQLGSLPLTAWYFYYVSCYGFFLNIMLVPVIGLVVPLLLFTLLMAVVWPPLAEACFGLVALLLELVTGSMGLVTGLLGTGQYYLGRPSVAAVIAYLLFLVAWRQQWWDSLSSSIWPRVGAAVLLLLLWWPRPPAVTTLTYLDVGQGSSAVLRTNRGEVYVFDCGPQAKTVAGYLAYCGVNRVDGIILSHGDLDHIGGLAQIAANVPVNGLYLEQEQLQRQELLTVQLPVVAMQQPGELALDNGKILLQPFASGQLESNGHQLAAIVQVDGWTIAFPGDMNLAETKQLAEQWSVVHIWTVPHHGSKYSGDQELYQSMQLEMAVISAGRNNLYGHPHQEILTALAEQHIAIRRTDREGAVILVLPQRG